MPYICVTYVLYVRVTALYSRLVVRSSRKLPNPCTPSLRYILLSYVIIMPPKAAAAKPKPKVKAVKARVITVNAVDENGRPRGLLERAKSIAQKRRANKPLGHPFTKLAETSTLDISQVRKVYEAVESVLTSDLKEHGVFRLPGLATFFLSLIHISEPTRPY